MEWIKTNHPECNMVVNNAAIVHRTNFRDDELMLGKAVKEIQTNLLAPVILSKLLLPVIEVNANPGIINITTGLVYTPRALYPVYNATKAALHSFPQVLRMQLENSPVSVVEVLYPVVDTPWHNGNVPDIAITPEAAVTEALVKIEKGENEIKAGKVKLLHLLSRIAPGMASKKINSL